MKQPPTKVAIARYWDGRGVFDMSFRSPGCFACGNQCGARSASLPEVGWKHAHLERAHLIPRCEGGSCEAGNIVLLCLRCHRQAPMIGVSAQPMIDWINSRECFLSWSWRRLLEECNAIDPKMLERVAESFTGDEIEAGLSAAQQHLRIATHPGGDTSATVAACVSYMHSFCDVLDLDLSVSLSSSCQLQTV